MTTVDGSFKCKDAGALATTGDRSVASVCTVVESAGTLARTVGRLCITGVAPDFGTGVGKGQATYEGTLTTP